MFYSMTAQLRVIVERVKPTKLLLGKKQRAWMESGMEFYLRGPLANLDSFMGTPIEWTEDEYRVDWISGK